MKLKPYPKYKDSGVEWLGEIPEGWEVRKLGYHAEMTVPMRDKPPVFDGDIPWIRIEDFDGKYIYDSKSDQRVSKKIIRSMNLKVYPVGTVLCSCSCNMGATAIVSSPLISNQTFIGIVPISNISSEFLYYLMNASSERLQYLGSGAIQQYLSKENFKNLKLALPPLQDQTSIANFLDHKTAKIDELIKKNEKLIKLLKEKRQAVISQAVTKGLDPNAKMKDSGIAWIGEIPEGWEKIPIKFFVKPKKFAIKTGPFGSDLKREDFTDQGIKIYNQQNVINNDFNLGDNYISQAKYEVLISFTTYPGDLLITSRGTIGKCAILPENCDRGILHPCLIRVQVDEVKCYKNFLAYVIQDSNYFYDQLLILSNATTIDVIYGDNLSNAFVLLPPINEQISITNFLDQKTARIDVTIQKILSQIEKLKEYRQTLISNVVTGKVRITGEL